MTKQRPPVNDGIDVGKSHLDVYLLERQLALHIENSDRAIAALVSRLARYRLERIVVEATGRLEQTFVRAAMARGLPVVIVSPIKVRRFAGALGQPTWTAIRFQPEWRWLEGRNEPPWYPTMWLVRQPAIGDWDSVFAEMGGHLETLWKETTGGS